MAFKTAKQYNDERFGGMFLLRNDGDCKDVIFLYRNEADVLVADTHYVKSADYSGYVHCTGRGCPACGKGLRIQTKLFIPLYDVESGEILFWDRSMQFENQLMQDVFERYPNPSEYVFRITRHGVARDVNTTYSIQAIAQNTYKSYNEICRENNTSFPECFEKVCKEVSSQNLSSMLSSDNVAGTGAASGVSGGLPNYQITPRAPRGAAAAADAPATVSTPASSGVSVPAEDWDDEDLDESAPNF